MHELVGGCRESFKYNEDFWEHDTSLLRCIPVGKYGGYASIAKRHGVVRCGDLWDLRNDIEFLCPSCVRRTGIIW